jgi:tRNA nucleotidyltransferase/poly(A) polymerase
LLAEAEKEPLKICAHRVSSSLKKIITAKNARTACKVAKENNYFHNFESEIDA